MISNRKTVRYYGMKYFKYDLLREWYQREKTSHATHTNESCHCVTDELCDMPHAYPLTKEIRLKIFDPIISNSFPVRYYGISGTNLPDIP